MDAITRTANIGRNLGVVHGATGSLTKNWEKITRPFLENQKMMDSLKQMANIGRYPILHNHGVMDSLTKFAETNHYLADHQKAMAPLMKAREEMQRQIDSIGKGSLTEVRRQLIEDPLAEMRRRFADQEMTPLMKAVEEIQRGTNFIGNLGEDSLATKCPELSHPPVLPPVSLAKAAAENHNRHIRQDMEELRQAIAKEHKRREEDSQRSFQNQQASHRINMVATFIAALLMGGFGILLGL